MSCCHVVPHQNWMRLHGKATLWTGPKFQAGSIRQVLWFLHSFLVLWWNMEGLLSTPSIYTPGNHFLSTHQAKAHMCLVESKLFSPCLWRPKPPWWSLSWQRWESCTRSLTGRFQRLLKRLSWTNSVGLKRTQNGTTTARKKREEHKRQAHKTKQRHKEGQTHTWEEKGEERSRVLGVKKNNFIIKHNAEAFMIINSAGGSKATGFRSKAWLLQQEQTSTTQQAKQTPAEGSRAIQTSHDTPI